MCQGSTVPADIRNKWSFKAIALLFKCLLCSKCRCFFGTRTLKQHRSQSEWAFEQLISFRCSWRKNWPIHKIMIKSINFHRAHALPLYRHFEYFPKSFKPHCNMKRSKRMFPFGFKLIEIELINFKCEQNVVERVFRWIIWRKSKEAVSILHWIIQTRA